jgi:glycosyltransferase involved in cell wall biosynthesis
MKLNYLMAKNKKIAIIGSYPPPYGGVSVHVKRVVALLNQDEYVLYNTSPNGYANAIQFYGKSKLFILFTFLFKNFRLIHHHTPNKLVRILLGLLGYFKNNIYLHIHGASLEDYFLDKSISTVLLKKLLKNVGLIADNSEILSLAERYNPKSVHQIDAFIPPIYEDEIYSSFVNQFPVPAGSIIISMVGWFREYRETDLYGFDLALCALEKLRRDIGLDVTIIASVNGISSKKIYDQFTKELSEQKLEKHFLLITDDIEEIWPIYIVSDLFIRPTISDGSSVALLEAMWFETKAIASDSVPRPEGVTIFKDRDVDDMTKKIRLIIEQGFLTKEERLKKIKNKKFESKLLKEIYKIER